jgi:hypothetical protein
MAGKIKSLNCELYEVASEIGRMNYAKFQLEREVKELQKTLDHYSALVFEREQYRDTNNNK